MRLTFAPRAAGALAEALCSGADGNDQASYLLLPTSYVSQRQNTPNYNNQIASLHSQ